MESFKDLTLFKLNLPFLTSKLIFVGYFQFCSFTGLQQTRGHQEQQYVYVFLGC